MTATVMGGQRLPALLLVLVVGAGMRHGNGGDRRLISASEIACFAYCPEQWRLQYGLKLPPANRAALVAGTRHHRRKAATERLAGFCLAIGRLMALIGVLLLLWLLWRS